MKRKMWLFFISIICISLLSGCWDKKLLKETRFILMIGIDKSKDGHLKGTYSSPNALSYPKSSIITETEGKTIRDLTIGVTNKVSEKLDTVKLKVVFIGEKLAKENGIYPYMDIFIRDPNNPKNPFLIINEGETSSYFTNPIPNEGSPSDYYQKLIQNHVDSGILTNMNIVKSSKLFKDSNSDFLLPYIKQSKDQTPTIGGLAIFNKDKYTGKTLSTSESVLYNLLNDQKGKQQQNLIVKIKDDSEPNIENYVSLTILQSKRKMKINSKNEQVSGNFSLDLKVSIIESPKYNVVKDVDSMTKEIERELTKKSNKIINKLQEANADGFAIGQYLHSFHNKEFKKLDWKGHAYKNADLTAKVKVTILEHGLIN